MAPTSGSSRGIRLPPISAITANYSPPGASPSSLSGSTPSSISPNTYTLPAVPSPSPTGIPVHPFAAVPRSAIPPPAGHYHGQLAPPAKVFHSLSHNHPPHPATYAPAAVHAPPPRPRHALYPSSPPIVRTHRLQCQRCGITETPEWRRGPNGLRTLCNACGLYHAKLVKRKGTAQAAIEILHKKVHVTHTKNGKRILVNELRRGSASRILQRPLVTINPVGPHQPVLHQPASLQPVPHQSAPHQSAPYHQGYALPPLAAPGAVAMPGYGPPPVLPPLHHQR